MGAPADPLASRLAWYALAVAVPLAVQTATFGLTRSLAPGSPSSLSQLAPLSLVLVLGVRLINPLDGPLAEEPGWRAYAQPELQRRRSPLAATAILGLLVAFWHLPLWLLPQFGATPADIASDFVGTIAVTFWYAWLFNHSGGSALITLISHAVEGTIHPQLFWTDPAVAATTTWLYSRLVRGGRDCHRRQEVLAFRWSPGPELTRECPRQEAGRKEQRLVVDDTDEVDPTWWSDAFQRRRGR